MVHPDYLLDKLSSVQLSEWEAYDRLDPVGAVRDDYWMTYLLSLMTNLTIQVNSKPGAKLTTADDFQPPWKEDAKVEKKQSVEEMKQRLLSIAATQNARVEALNRRKQKNEHRSINSDIRS